MRRVIKLHLRLTQTDSSRAWLRKLCRLIVSTRLNSRNFKQRNLFRQNTANFARNLPVLINIQIHRQSVSIRILKLLKITCHDTLATEIIGAIWKCQEATIGAIPTISCSRSGSRRRRNRTFALGALTRAFGALGGSLDNVGIRLGLAFDGSTIGKSNEGTENKKGLDEHRSCWDSWSVHGKMMNRLIFFVRFEMSPRSVCSNDSEGWINRRQVLLLITSNRWMS